MAKREPKVKRVKRNESDFQFQIEDRTALDRGRPFNVIAGRVVDVPIRSKKVKVGVTNTTVELCYHSKPLKYACPTCEWEAPRIPVEWLTKAPA